MLCVLPTRFVVVRKHDTVPAVQVFRVAMIPFSGPHWVAGGDAAAFDDRQNIFLALGNEHERSAIGCKQLRETKRHAVDTFEIVNPASAAIRPALSEVLWLVSDNLKRQLTGGGLIVERREYLSFGAIPVAVPID